MNKYVNEILRLKTLMLLACLWLLIWGVKESAMTASLLTGFIALSGILAHIINKEYFRGYKWDVGKRLNAVWDEPVLSRAIIASAMLFARILIYVAIVLAMAFLTLSLLLKGSAFGYPPSHQSRPTPSQIEILKEEHARIWPESDIYLLMGQIKAESLWKETAKRVEPNGMTSYGLMQVLDMTFIELRKKHKTLADIEPVQMLQARYGIRAGLLYDLQMWNSIKCKESELQHYYYTFRAYNGGLGLLHKEIDRAGTCNTEAVAIECKRKILTYKWGTLDLCKVNLDYPVKIFRYAEKYRGI